VLAGPAKRPDDPQTTASGPRRSAGWRRCWGSERVYFDAASLLTQIGRGELLALVGSDQ